MELTSAMDKANMNLKGAGEQNMAFAGKIQMLEVDITKIRQVRKVPEVISSKAKSLKVNYEPIPYLSSFVSKNLSPLNISSTTMWTRRLGEGSAKNPPLNVHVNNI